MSSKLKPRLGCLVLLDAQEGTFVILELGMLFMHAHGPLVATCCANF